LILKLNQSPYKPSFSDCIKEKTGRSKNRAKKEQKKPKKDKKIR